MCFPHLGEDDNFRKRLQRFEEYLQRVLVHHVFLSRTFTLDEAKSLAELQPRIFRESTGNTSAHEALPLIILATFGDRSRKNLFVDF